MYVELSLVAAVQLFVLFNHMIKEVENLEFLIGEIFNGGGKCERSFGDEKICSS